MSALSRAGLAIVLSRLEGFKTQKVRVEQYITDSEIAATILWDAYLRGDIDGKVIADLGAGTGILGLGAMLLGASRVYFVESDADALEIAKKNYRLLKSEGFILGEAKFANIDVGDFKEKIDIVVQNPPFGVKKRHADRYFLEEATKMAKIIYSLHKSDSVKFMESFSRDNNLSMTTVGNFSFPLKATLSYHRRKIYRFEVSCFRLQKK